MTLKWSKLSKKQRKKITGIAVYRNGKLVKRLKKTATSFKNTGLKANTAYKYQLKTYKKIKKGKKYKYKYSNASSKKAVTTEEASGSTSTSPSTGGSSGTSTPNIKQTIHEEYSYGEVLSTNEPSVYLIWHGGRYVNMVVYVYRDGEQIAGPLDEDTYYYGDNDVKWSTSYTYTIKTVLGEYEAVSDPVTITTPDEPVEEETTPSKKLSAADGECIDVSDAYDILNEFRMNPENQWYYNQAGTVVTLSGMYELKKDETYEALAEERAKERWTAYYTDEIEFDPINPHLGANIAYKTVNWKAENLSWSSCEFTAREQICGGKLLPYYVDYSTGEIVYEEDEGWAETSEWYSKQGHRRVMLTQNAKKVGIACFQVDTTQCWVMVVGN